MRRNVIFILAIVITSCSTTPTQVTATSGVTVTLTFEPTNTPETTATPTLSPGQKWQDRLGEGFEVRTDGTIWDKTSDKQIPGVDWIDETWTYEFDGNPNFTVPIKETDLSATKDVDGKLTGAINFIHLGWTWNGKEMVRKELQEEPLFSLFETITILANPTKVDLTHRSLDNGPHNLDPLVHANMQPGKNSPRIIFQGLNVSINRYGLVENIVTFPDDRGGWKVIETTTFIMYKATIYPYTIVSYRNHEGAFNIMLIDQDNIVPKNGMGLGEEEWQHPTGLSEYYVDHAVNLQY